MKKCIKCKQKKPLSDFCKNKNTKDGLGCNCRLCISQYYFDNKTKLNENNKKYRQKNKDKIQKQQTKYESSPEYKEHKLQYNVEYRKRNKIKIASYRRQWEKLQYNNIVYKIKKNLRRRVNDAIKNNRKSAKTLELLGCTVTEFKQHLESQFQSGMSWDNYGIIGWHIDHIIPCYKFDLSKSSQQRECFHYTNQRPLWAKDNLSRPRK